MSLKQSITNQENLSDLLHLQELLYSNSIETSSIKSFLGDLQKKYSNSDIDHQLILAFSLDYSKIPILAPFLSTKSMKSVDFIHADQEFIYQLIEANFIFPLKVIWEKCMELSQFFDSDYETIYDPSDHSWTNTYCLSHDVLAFKIPFLNMEENLVNKLLDGRFLTSSRSDSIENDSVYMPEIDYQTRIKEDIEDIIDNDDLERLRLLPNDFDFILQYLFFYIALKKIPLNVLNTSLSMVEILF